MVGPAFEITANEAGSLRERSQFGAGHLARQGDHAAIGAGVEAVRLHEAESFPDGGGDLLGALDVHGGHVDHADQHILASKQAEEREGHARARAFQ